MKRSGFTIIEMLVVVIIVAILAGLVFKMIGAGGTSSDRAKARRQVEALANACEEYRAEYGRYPPVAKDPDGSQPLHYSYPRNGQYWTRGGKGGAESLAGILSKVKVGELRAEKTYVFHFGLMSYLVTRVEGRAEHANKQLFQTVSGISEKQSHWRSQNSDKLNNQGNIEDLVKAGTISRGDDWDKKWNCTAIDSPRDARVAKRIWPLIKDIVRTEEDHCGYQGHVWTNSQCTVWDPWGNQLHYRSDPPYESYRIWSSGPDGKSETADDISSGNEN